jgi:uncharacterized SAM-binding protein YcdF (DUF218 family)
LEGWVLFLIKKTLTALILPPTSLILLAAAGFFLHKRGRRGGMPLMWVALILLLGLSLPVVDGALNALVCDASPLDIRRAKEAQAIVILSGGVRRNAVEYAGDAPGDLTLARVRYGAKLAKNTGLPVLVTGGRVFGRGQAEAEVMRNVLEQEFGIPVRWAELESRNTHENAVLTARILKQEGITRILLVTHGVDARRARREFVAAGLEPIVAPTVVPGQSLTLDSPTELLPNASSLHGSMLALYELLANVAMTLTLNRG